MRLVVDTAVMIAAIRSDTGASRHLLVAGLERRFVMLASVPLLIEYQAVMTGGNTWLHHGSLSGTSRFCSTL
jgi:predicted nucleic acid-binding protein